ncbi:hypothetical protein [Miltoncostaea oceani]|uniref:hypothetical protein n=1 Tax=Miltoncostaea oceani TaxID=2843216 RepID=UPI001C3CCD45|nr:hypothetical protein [Miltoncostaea oceani]
MAGHEAQLIHCARCDRFVPAVEYTRGRPAEPSRWIDTGPVYQPPIPVYLHGGPAPCHPTPIGMTGGSWARSGYWTEPRRAVPWAPGRVGTDHGCTDCRGVVVQLEAARTALDRLEGELVELSRQSPSGLVSPSEQLSIQAATAYRRSIRIAAFQSLILLGVVAWLLTHVLTWIGLLTLLAGAWAIRNSVGTASEARRRESERFSEDSSKYEAALRDFRRHREERVPVIKASIARREADLVRLGALVDEQDRRQSGATG